MIKHDRETDHYLKMGKMLISLDFCILKNNRDDDWFRDKHRQETVALLQDVVSERVREFYAEKRGQVRSGRGDKAKPASEKPKMLQGNTVKICYKFTKRPVTQRCLLMRPKLESATLFPEKLHVYICQYHPSTVLHTTAKLLHTVYKDPVPPTAGVSNYFQPASNQAAGSVATVKVGTVTDSATRKRNRLRRIVSRQNIAARHGNDVNSTDSDSWCPARNPLTGQGAGNSDEDRGTAKAPGERPGVTEGAEEAGRAEDEDWNWQSSSGERRLGKRQQAQAWEGGEAISYVLAPSCGRDISEPAKKRKMDKDWGEECRGTRAASTRTGVDNSDIPDGRTGGPVTRQRTSDGTLASEDVSGQNAGRPAEASMIKRCFGLGAEEDDAVAMDWDVVAREEDAVAGEEDVVTNEDAVTREEDAVTREEDAVAREEDAVAREGDAIAREEEVAREEDVVAREEDVDQDCEIVGQPVWEVFSDGDVDCLDRLPSGPESMSMLSTLHLQRLVLKNKHYLKQIFVGKRHCKRHADYKLGGLSRANLMYEARYGPYSEEQVECIMSELVKVYCAHHNKYLDYVSKVLLPEALTKICMDALRVSPEEALVVMETTPLCGDSMLLGSRFQ